MRACPTALLLIFLLVAATPAANAATLREACPFWSDGPLANATLGECPQGVLLVSGEVTVTAAEMEQALAKGKRGGRAGIERYRLLALEELAAVKLLQYEAAAWAKREKLQLPPAELVGRYLKTITDAVQVSEAEVQAWYEANREMTGDLPFAQVKEAVRDYVLTQKREEASARYIDGIATRNPVTISDYWVRQAYLEATANPVDRARRWNKPTLVEFGADGCAPCAMMAPILERVRKQFGDKLQVISVNTRQDPLLGARFRVRVIPVQVIFDRSGKEVYRHLGFLPESELRRQLAAVGVQ